MQQKKCELFINIACISLILGILLLFVNVVIGFVLIFSYIGLSIYTMKKYPNEYKFWLEKMQKTKQISSNVEAEKKRNISKYKEYNYSYETYNTKNIINNHNQLKEYYIECSKNEEARLKRAKYENFQFTNINNSNKSAQTINSNMTNKYYTTLKSCTCGDFEERQLPCKHMYRLADIFSCFELYAQQEKETVNKLMVLWKNKKLVSTLIDIFYRIRDKKNKYYTKITPNMKKLADLNLISINEIPLYDLVDFKYNANELKGILIDKGIKSSMTKKELIEIFVSDEKLTKNISNSLKHITLNFEHSQSPYIIECLNYINYND